MTDRPTLTVSGGVTDYQWAPSFGAVPVDGGVRFRVWASSPGQLALLVRRDDGLHRLTPVRDADGIWELFVPDLPVGSRYAYVIDSGTPLPDPASRFQPDGVHAWSEVVDPLAYNWRDEAWRGVDPERLVIYELHVGTFTPAWNVCRCRRTPRVPARPGDHGDRVDAARRFSRASELGIRRRLALRAGARVWPA